jgi:hypothetical protein
MRCEASSVLCRPARPVLPSRRSRWTRSAGRGRHVDCFQVGASTAAGRAGEASVVESVSRGGCRSRRRTSCVDDREQWPVTECCRSPACPSIRAVVSTECRAAGSRLAPRDAASGSSRELSIVEPAWRRPGGESWSWRRRDRGQQRSHTLPPLPTSHHHTPTSHHHLRQRGSPALTVRRECTDTCCRNRAPNRAGGNRVSSCDYLPRHCPANSPRFISSQSHLWGVDGDSAYRHRQTLRP